MVLGAASHVGTPQSGPAMVLAGIAHMVAEYSLKLWGEICSVLGWQNSTVQVTKGGVSGSVSVLCPGYDQSLCRPGVQCEAVAISLWSSAVHCCLSASSGESYSPAAAVPAAHYLAAQLEGLEVVKDEIEGSPPIGPIN